MCWYMVLIYFIIIHKHLILTCTNNTFTYKFDGKRWYGVITINNPPKDIRNQMKLDVVLILKAIPPSNFKWQLKLMESKPEIQNYLLGRQSVHYTLLFPFRSILPKVVKVTLNNELICVDKVETGLITEIHIEHTLKFDSNILNNYLLEDTDFNIDRKGFPTRLNTFDIDFEPENEVNPLNEYEEICGKASTANPLVVNGRTVNRGQFPWLAAIYLRTHPKGLDFHCSGTLISDQHVITANHCIQENKNEPPLTPKNFLVLLGKFNLSNWHEKDSRIVELRNIHMHPDYAKSTVFYSDLAVLVLSFPITFSFYIRPICVSFDLFVSDYNNYGLVVGWGGVNNIADIPKQSRMIIVNREECLQSNSEFIYLTSNVTYCAVSTNKHSGPCNGDSGTGMYIKHNERYYLHGVVSLSLRDPNTFSCNLDQFTVFTSIIYFEDWFLNVLEM